MKLSKEICQSCSTPILKEAHKGTEKDGIFSKLYCRHCYQWGVFNDPKMTVEQMGEIVRQKMIKLEFPRFLAKLLANRVYILKRWEVVKA